MANVKLDNVINSWSYIFDMGVEQDGRRIGLATQNGFVGSYNHTIIILFILLLIMMEVSRMLRLLGVEETI